MKRLLILLLTVCLLLCGCAAPAQESTATTTEATTQTTTTEATTEAAVLYRHPLNGAPLEEPFQGRATAVVINNIKDCLPQYGISKADIYYEFETEGYITRCLAIYSDVSQVATIGPVRSARSYFNNVAVAYDAPLIHCGGSDAALKGLYDDTSKIPDWQHIDQRFNGSYFFRDTERRSQGYAYEHTLFTTGEMLVKGLTKKEYNTVSTLDVGLQFADAVSLSGENAEKVVVTFPGNKTTTMTYEEATGLYTMSQYGGTTVDAYNGEEMTFKNVIALYTEHWKKKDSNYSRSYYDLFGEGDGYLAIDGVIVPIRWSRESLEKPFVYTLADGTPITLAAGKTYIGVSSLKSTPIAYE